MSGATMAVLATAAVASTAYSIYSGEEQRKAMGDANRKAEANAKKQQEMQQQEINKANAKTPDIAGIVSGNAQAAKGGGGSTMLTGPQGVDAGSLSLSKNTLLGQ